MNESRELVGRVFKIGKIINCCYIICCPMCSKEDWIERMSWCGVLQVLATQNTCMQEVDFSR